MTGYWRPAGVAGVEAEGSCSDPRALRDPEQTSAEECVDPAVLHYWLVAELPAWLGIAVVAAAYFEVARAVGLEPATAAEDGSVY